MNGNNTKPYIKAAVDNPLTCDSPSLAGTTIHLQNGNDLAQASVNDINAATNNGTRSVAIVIPVIDKTCGCGRADVQPERDDRRLHEDADRRQLGGLVRRPRPSPPRVLTLGKKNICVTNDCGAFTPESYGGTVQVDPVKVHLVR